MINYSRSADIAATRLSRSDLENLYKLIEADFPAGGHHPPDITVSAHANGVDVSANSLTLFLSHTELPSVLRRLTIEMLGWNALSKIERSLTLTFYDNFISLRVRGDSESWVIGKTEQTSAFLRKHRTKLWFIHTPTGYLIQGVLGMLTISGAVVSLIMISKKGFDAFGTSISLTVLTATIFLYAASKSNYVEIRLRSQEGWLARHQTAISVSSGIATILGAIASIVALFFH